MQLNWSIISKANMSYMVGASDPWGGSENNDGESFKT
jgi:hypothetical protein